MCQILSLYLLERDNINYHKFVETFPLTEGLLLEKLCTYRSSFSDSCLVTFSRKQSYRDQVPCKLLYKFLRCLLVTSFFEKMNLLVVCHVDYVNHKELLTVGQITTFIRIGVV